jgi:hypothetical protein
MRLLSNGLAASILIANIPTGVWAQSSTAGERSDPSEVAEIFHQLSGWFSSHPGVEFALGVCVVTAIASMIYNRLRG